MPTLPSHKAKEKMKRFCASNAGFSLIEIMVVLILLSIMAAFALPKYTKFKEKTEERTAIVNLKMMASKMDLSRAQIGLFPPEYMANTNQVNTVLHLNIAPGDINYTCTPPTNPFEVGINCFAQKNSGWGLSVRKIYSLTTRVLLTDELISCFTMGTYDCPTCTSTGCPGISQ